MQNGRTTAARQFAINAEILRGVARGDGLARAASSPGLRRRANNAAPASFGFNARRLYTDGDASPADHRAALIYTPSCN